MLKTIRVIVILMCARRENTDDKSATVKSPGPVVTQLDEKDISTFATGRPLQDEPDYKICKMCKKPIIKSVAAEHVRACLRAKAERTKERKKQREEAAAAAAGKGKDDAGSVAGGDEDAPMADAKKKGPGAKKMAKKDADPGGAKGKKRKADAAAKLPKEPKAKKKKEKPAKPEPKPKAPVDVEKQCGVQLPNGALCARSLTCKSHSMGAKRSVLNRSQPYDVLLAAYQKKNQAKQQSTFHLWLSDFSGSDKIVQRQPLMPVARRRKRLKLTQCLSTRTRRRNWS